MTLPAIAELYARHGHAVLRRCRQLLHDEEEARDALHEVFVHLLESPGGFRGLSSPATYLFGVATHLCLRRVRDRAARGAGWRATVARELERERPGADRVVEARELARALLDEDPESAAIAHYHFVDGLTQGEIARLVGRSRVTVNLRLRRLRLRAQRLEEGP